jgi:UDP-galactopyranose mutase
MTIDLNKYDVIIVGAGLSGSVIAQQFVSQLDKKVAILDKRNHIGGNCYDYIDENGILMNKYGAHIFHTNDDRVWNYVQNFSKWERWDHKVLGYIDENLIPIPVNINTVNKIFNLNLKDENDMNTWIKNEQIEIESIHNSEQVALASVGKNLYEKIFKNYTYKQWNKFPSELDPEVLSRIPLRKNFDDRYFTDKYQALPKFGYTKFFESLLDHKNIDVHLNSDFFDHQIPNNKIVIYTGPIDQYFKNYGYPSLEYRSINFIKEIYKNVNYFQSNSVVNYPEMKYPFTRIVEYKHFLHQKSDHTTIVKEITTDSGEPYYPVPNKINKEIYEQYKLLAETETLEKNIHFIGRLANYKYFNMDQAIANSLDYFHKVFLKNV